MKLNRKSLLIAAAAALVCAGCAKVISASSNESVERYILAWLKVNYEGNYEEVDGVYLLGEETVGTGVPVGDSTFVFVEYSYKTMDGKIQAATDEATNRQIGSFSYGTYYGPIIWQLGNEGLAVGFENIIKGMKVGGTRTFLMPRWMNTDSRYNSQEEYIKHDGNSSEDYIYTIRITDATSDIMKWQIDSMERYMAANGGQIDSLEYGFYYKSILKPAGDEEKFSSDTSFYVNYIGRLLNGQVFDTTIADTAKMYNIYSPSRSYSPVKINYGSEAEKITMGSDESTVVAGFSKALFQLTPHEKSWTMFYSQLGYSYSGSGSNIPSFSPLIFELEQVDYSEE